MAGTIPPNKAAQTPGKAAAAAFGAFVFWLLVAGFFPYPALLPYWPEAPTWGPVILYGIAFFNLARVALNIRRLLRRMRATPPTLRPAGRPAAKAPSRADRADRAGRAEARAAKDSRRNAALPSINRPPTVQRMR